MNKTGCDGENNKKWRAARSGESTWGEGSREGRSKCEGEGGWIRKEYEEKGDATSEGLGKSLHTLSHPSIHPGATDRASSFVRRHNPSRSTGRWPSADMLHGRTGTESYRDRRNPKVYLGSHLAPPSYLQIYVQHTYNNPSPAISWPMPKEIPCGHHLTFFISKAKLIIRSPTFLGPTPLPVLVNGADSPEV